VDVIIPTRESMFAINNHKVSLLFPKNFRILALLESNNNVAIEESVKSIPTYFSEIILDRKVEFTYADSAMCKVKRKDKTYIRLIFVVCVCILNT
jgi:hypothetical protein